MRSVFVKPLTGPNGTEAVSKVIEYLDEYSMNRDDLFETLSELQFPESAEFKDIFKLITPQTKSAFTREYNKGSHKSQILVSDDMVSKTSKKKRGAAAAGGDDDGEGGGEEDGGSGAENDGEEEEEEVNLDAFKPKKPTKAAAAASSTSASNPKKAKAPKTESKATTSPKKKAKLSKSA
jgi:replication factor C subunit 1